MVSFLFYHNVEIGEIKNLGNKGVLLGNAFVLAGGIFRDRQWRNNTYKDEKHAKKR